MATPSLGGLNRAWNDFPTPAPEFHPGAFVPLLPAVPGALPNSGTTGLAADSCPEMNKNLPGNESREPGCGLVIGSSAGRGVATDAPQRLSCLHPLRSPAPPSLAPSHFSGTASLLGGSLIPWTLAAQDYTMRALRVSPDFWLERESLRLHEHCFI